MVARLTSPKLIKAAGLAGKRQEYRARCTSTTRWLKAERNACDGNIHAAPSDQLEGLLGSQALY